MAAEMFRTKAAERLGSPDRLDQLMPVTPPRAWVALIGGLLIVLVVAIWGLFGSISSTVQGVGMLSRPKGLAAIAAPRAGLVTSVSVRTGDVVRKGQELLKLAPVSLADASAGGAVGEATRESGATLDGPANVETISSPISGRVLEVRVVEGYDVIDDELLVLVESSEEPLLAIVYVPAEQGHRLARDREVHVTPSAPPHAGPLMLKGKVRQAGLLPVSRETLMRSLNNEAWVESLLRQGPAVEVIVEFPDAKHTADYVSGSACRAEITVERRRPISLLFPDADEDES
ncbi:MAG TPA: biotin/lipoyl-binding protein [Pirellulales bacterium]